MKKTIGTIICESRKEKGMTQVQLGEKMGVSDKAVSKWERDLSCPDIGLIPELAKVLGVTVEELMGGERQAVPAARPVRQLTRLILRAVPLAIGVAVTVLGALHKIDTGSAVSLLGIGLVALSLYALQES